MKACSCGKTLPTCHSNGQRYQCDCGKCYVGYRDYVDSPRGDYIEIVDVWVQQTWGESHE